MRKRLAIVLLVGALGIAGLIAAVFLVPGATGGRATPEQVVGSWASTQGARLTLHPDGTLTAADLPTDFSTPDNLPIHPFTGDGSWTLEPKPSLGDQELKLVLSTAEGRIGVRVLITDEGARGGIYLPIDEGSGSKYLLRKSA
ncbi:hypothetical protein ACIGXM_34245 [Kitasatospora sp. NPDC052896]|uniref:hypothetical protein n=1 Tax=Kitasatospora sp. NPDC052896 TaxID=3364061 RepID=UPI0037CB4B80